MTPEELEAYRNKGGRKMYTHENYKADVAAGKTKNEIAKAMGVSLPTLYNRIKVWEGQPVESKKEKPAAPAKVPETNDELIQNQVDEYGSIISKLKDMIREKDSMISKLEEHISKLEAETAIPLHSACDDLESEIASLQDENNLLTALLKRKL
ncbi:hypothetical protein [Metabacillus sp. 84]|uniref:hypothetical protein n=1 Tax=Metabacillus sp. 84 TaxID=3404705 RepID=UPI003CE9331D